MQWGLAMTKTDLCIAWEAVEVRLRGRCGCSLSLWPLSLTPLLGLLLHSNYVSDMSSPKHGSYRKGSVLYLLLSKPTHTN